MYPIKIVWAAKARRQQILLNKIQIRITFLTLLTFTLFQKHKIPNKIGRQTPFIVTLTMKQIHNINTTFPTNTHVHTTYITTCKWINLFPLPPIPFQRSLSCKPPPHQRVSTLLLPGPPHWMPLSHYEHTTPLLGAGCSPYSRPLRSRHHSTTRPARGCGAADPAGRGQQYRPSRTPSIEASVWGFLYETLDRGQFGQGSIRWHADHAGQDLRDTSGQLLRHDGQEDGAWELQCKKSDLLLIVVPFFHSLARSCCAIGGRW